MEPNLQFHFQVGELPTADLSCLRTLRRNHLQCRQLETRTRVHTRIYTRSHRHTDTKTHARALKLPGRKIGGKPEILALRAVACSTGLSDEELTSEDQTFHIHYTMQG